MTADQIFSLCSAIAMAGWAGIVFAPRWIVTRDWVAPVTVSYTHLTLPTTPYV